MEYEDDQKYKAIAMIIHYLCIRLLYIILLAALVLIAANI